MDNGEFRENILEIGESYKAVLSYTYVSVTEMHYPTDLILGIWGESRKQLETSIIANQTLSIWMETLLLEQLIVLEMEHRQLIIHNFTEMPCRASFMQLFRCLH